MKREARMLLSKALDSLLLSVQHFNAVTDCGRVATVLILLDHSLEMLLKAGIVQKGGTIREKGAAETIGFDPCVRKALSNGTVKFLSEDQALALQAINGLRDAAQHYLVDLSEQQLYLHAQSGLTLIKDILNSVFGVDLLRYLPARVMPISTVAPTDTNTLFETEANEIRRLLGPGRRRRTEAHARLVPLAVLEAAIGGKKLQPSERELGRYAKLLDQGQSWESVFPGLASVSFSTEGTGPAIALRLVKKEGVPVQLVPEGTPGASVVAVKRVSELDFYNLGRDQLARHVGLTGPKTTAVVEYLGLKRDEDYYKEFVIGKSRFGRYSQKAIEAVGEALARRSPDEIWREYASARRHST